MTAEQFAVRERGFRHILQSFLDEVRGHQGSARCKFPTRGACRITALPGPRGAS